MAKEHSTLTGASLHEPKGVESAASGEVYVANGDATSGTWSKLEGNELASTTSSNETYGKIITADGAGGSAYGQKVWKDIVGIYEADSGPSAPSRGTFVGTDIDAWAYGDGDSGDYTFHMPHDYAPGTDIHLHIHWGHNADTTFTGDVTFDVEVAYAKRVDATTRTVFSAVTSTIQETGVTIATFPRYCHAVTEVEMSTSGGSANKLDTDDLEVDGLVLVHVARNDAGGTNPTISTSSPVDSIYIFNVDIHYQADCEGTFRKDPPYYT